MPGRPGLGAVLLGAAVPARAASTLTVYYPFNGGQNDASGSGINATAYGAPAYASGLFGQQAASLDGATQYLVMPQPATDGLTSWTMGVWINTSANTSNDTYWQRPTLIGFATSYPSSGNVQLQTNGGLVGFSNGLYSGGDLSYVSGPLCLSTTALGTTWY